MNLNENIVFRSAETKDLDQLAQLEQRCFDYDQLTRRNFHWMLTRANADLVVVEENKQIVGYVLTLYHSGTSLARLYSMAVDAGQRGKGLGNRLMEAAERAAQKRKCAYLRLEVRPDNLSAIKLYESRGYRQFDVIQDYYDDHADAKRFEKRILRYVAHGDRRPVPFYAQSTDFTCGPAALMMAMHYLNDRVELSKRLELQLWREATTIFMTAGHGGCGPHGLALAAHRRGFDVSIYINHSEALFVEGVRSESKKEVIAFVQADFESQIQDTSIKLIRRPFSIDDIVDEIRAGAMPLVLISSYRLTESKAPHWVLITDVDEHYIYLHNPEVDEETGKTIFDCTHIPILKNEFERMAQFGRNRLRTLLVLNGKT